MKDYSLVFIIDKLNRKVLLIKKLRPEFLAGTLNGVGGKLEQSDENIFYCAQREIKEETNIDLEISDLVFMDHICSEEHQFNLHTFYSFANNNQINQRKNMIDEQHDWYLIENVLRGDYPLSFNVRDYLSYINNLF